MLFTHERLKPKNYREGKDLPTFWDQKYDGLRVTFFKQASGTLYAFGRDLAPHLEMSDTLSQCEWFRQINEGLPPLTSLDGELYVPGKPCTDVVSHRKERSTELRFIPFAMPVIQNTYCYEDDIDEIDAKILSWTGIEPVERHLFFPEDTQEKFLDLANRLAIEGFVLKKGHYHDWWKVKRTKTLDAVVMDLKEGNNSNAGKYSSVVIGLYDGTELKELTAIGMGFTHAQIDLLGKNDIGRVVEIEYQSVASQGKLQHGRFLRWRDDKPAIECLWSQLPSVE